MKNTPKKYEFHYNDCAPSYTHKYLCPILVKLIPEKTKLRILDLGCGNGSFVHLLAQRGHEVVGIDSSESGINLAKKKYPGYHFINADIYKLPFDILENSFDIVLAVEVIEHLLYPGELLRAAKKCLRTNSRFILTTPYHGYLKNLTLSILNEWDMHTNIFWNNRHINFFSARTLTTLLKKEGFADFRFRFAGRLPYLWKSMICSSSPFLKNEKS